jgi:hypothetical protein
MIHPDRLSKSVKYIIKSCASFDNCILDYLRACVEILIEEEHGIGDAFPVRKVG